MVAIPRAFAEVGCLHCAVAVCCAKADADDEQEEMIATEENDEVG